MQTERVAGPVPGFAASRPVSFSVSAIGLTAGWCWTSVVAFAAGGALSGPELEPLLAALKQRLQTHEQGGVAGFRAKIKAMEAARQAQIRASPTSQTRAAREAKELLLYLKKSVGKKQSVKAWVVESPVRFIVRHLRAALYYVTFHIVKRWYK